MTCPHQRRRYDPNCPICKLETDLIAVLALALCVSVIIVALETITGIWIHLP